MSSLRRGDVTIACLFYLLLNYASALLFRVAPEPNFIVIESFDIKLFVIKLMKAAPEP